MRMLCSISATARRDFSALALAAATRFHGLTANAMWADELFSWRLTTLELPDLLRIVAGDVHPPLYFLMLKLVTGIFGDGLIVMRAAG